MQVTFYENVSKRINSTYRPTGGVPKNVRLKEPTDMLNPVFILQDMNIQFTHAYAFGMYYQVTNRVFVTNDIQEVHCRVDALATARDYISSYNCFVERCETQSTSYLDDSLVSVIGNIVDQTSVAESLFIPTQLGHASFSPQGCFLVRVIAPPPITLSSPGLSTGIVTYAVDRSEMYKLLNYAFDQTQFSDVLADATIKAVFNPIDYLIDVKWIPVTPTTISNSSSTDRIPLGWWTTDAVGYPVITLRPPTYAVMDPTYNIDFDITPHRHYSDYRLTSNRFTNAHLYVPGVGDIDIDATYLLGRINVKYMIDRMTGDAFAEVTSIIDNDVAVIGKYTAQLSCKVNLAQASVDLQGVVSNILAGSARLYAGNYVTAAAGLVDTIPKITNPTTRMIGENGTMGGLSQAMTIGLILTTTSYGSCDRPNTCGYPLYKNRLLGNLSGFIKCGNASISTPFMEPVNEQVNELLNSGFYFE